MQAIFYNIKIGYAPSGFDSNSDHPYSDITWVDDTVIAIPWMYDTSWTNASYTSAELDSALATKFGTDTAPLIGLLPSFKNSYSLSKMDYFGTSEVLYPNIYDVMRNGAGTPKTFIFFPSIGRAGLYDLSAEPIINVTYVFNSNSNMFIRSVWHQGWLAGRNQQLGFGVLILPDGYIEGTTNLSTASKGSIHTGSNNNIYTYYSGNGFLTWLFANNPLPDYTPPDPNADPYNPGGDTGDDETDGTGGDGTYDDTTEQVDVPDLPTLSATDSGFLTLYNPSLAQIQALGAYMWSPLFDIDTFKKLFSDPMGAILGLAIVPVAPPVSGPVSVVLGNIDSGITMPLVSSQYVSVNLGTVTIEPYWGAYLDYSPYTTVELYLPFIGSKRLDADDVMGHTIGVTYQIDLLSGACVAMVTVDGSVMYQYIGQCSGSIPITGRDMTNVINGALTIAGALGSAVLGGGASAIAHDPYRLTVTAHAVMGSKPRVEKSGATSGMGGMLAVGRPYLTITRPRQALPEDQNRFTGYPSFITRTLGTLSGYTEVLTVHLENMTCTDQEKQQITQLLSQGVFF